MAAEAESQPVPKPRTTVSVVLLVAYTAAVAWIFHGQATSWPHEGSWAYAVFFFMCPGILFQSFSLAYARRTGRPLTRRALTRLATIPLGLVIAAALSSWASTLAMRNFEQAYAPFVAKVGANPADACRSIASYFEIPTMAAYNQQAGRGRPTSSPGFAHRVLAKFSYDPKRFVLGFYGDSVDIDGSTIYYDSVTRAWRKFHNDNEEAKSVYTGLTAGLTECPLRAQ